MRTVVLVVGLGSLGFNISARAEKELITLFPKSLRCARRILDPKGSISGSIISILGSDQNRIVMNLSGGQRYEVAQLSGRPQDLVFLKSSGTILSIDEEANLITFRPGDPVQRSFSLSLRRERRTPEITYQARMVKILPGETRGLFEVTENRNSGASTEFRSFLVYVALPLDASPRVLRRIRAEDTMWSKVFTRWDDRVIPMDETLAVVMQSDSGARRLEFFDRASGNLLRRASLPEGNLYDFRATRNSQGIKFILTNHPVT